MQLENGAGPARPGSGGTGAVLYRSLKGAIYGFIPMIAFYVAQRAGGVRWAVGVGVGLSVAIIPLEQRMTGTMRWCWIGLIGVVASGGLALFTHNPRLFFIKSVVGDGTLGLAMLGSIVIGKPLVAMFAGMAVKIPEWYKSTRAYKQSFTAVTFAWGIVNCARAAGRGYMVARGTLGQVMVVNLATGWPVFAALVAFSVWYPRRLAHRYVKAAGWHKGMVDEILLGGVEEAFDVELAVGAEE